MLSLHFTLQQNMRSYKVFVIKWVWGLTRLRITAPTHPILFYLLTEAEGVLKIVTYPQHPIMGINHKLFTL